jgi:hypothetical protein
VILKFIFCLLFPFLYGLVFYYIICLWVKRAWEGISTEIIFDSFKKCKISNDLGSDPEVSDDGISDDSNDDDYDFDDDDEIIDDDEVIGEDDIM